MSLPCIGTAGTGNCPPSLLLPVPRPVAVGVDLVGLQVVEEQGLVAAAPQAVVGPPYPLLAVAMVRISQGGAGISLAD